MATYRCVLASVDVGNAGLRFCLGRRLRLRGQLQHACMLTYAKMCKQYDLAIGELKGIMVRTWIVHVDLPEPSHRVTDELRVFLEKAQLKSRNHPLDLPFDRDLGARKKDYRRLLFPDGRKPTGRRIPKFRRDEFVSDLRRSRCSSVQTVVAHGSGAPMVAVPAYLFHQS